MKEQILFKKKEISSEGNAHDKKNLRLTDHLTLNFESTGRLQPFN